LKAEPGAYTTVLAVLNLNYHLYKKTLFTSNHKKPAFKRRNTSLNHFYFLSLKEADSFVENSQVASSDANKPLSGE
jgi:hypothetical protein